MTTSIDAVLCNLRARLLNHPQRGYGFVSAVTRDAGLSTTWLDQFISGNNDVSTKKVRALEETLNRIDRENLVVVAARRGETLLAHSSAG